MSTADHARFEELACLAAYAELEPAEERALAAHLAACDPCRRFAAELSGGLAALAAREAASAAPELPLDWRTALDARVRTVRRPRLAPVFTFAAGLAAGLAVALVTGWRFTASQDAASQAPTLLVATNAAPAAARPEFDAPPPRTASQGQGALLALVRPR